MEEATHMGKLRASDWKPDLDNIKTGLWEANYRVLQMNQCACDMVQQAGELISSE